MNRNYCVLAAFVIIVIFPGCPNGTVTSSRDEFYLRCEYALDFEKHSKIILSAGMQWSIEFYVSKPDLDGLKKYINEKALPGLSANLSSATMGTENTQKLIYTLSMLNAWLKINDIGIIKDNFFYRRENYDIVF